MGRDTQPYDVVISLSEKTEMLQSKTHKDRHYFIKHQNHVRSELVHYNLTT